MTSIVTLYNHKGGVSKTTTSFNLAHALAEHCEAKVLLVDADPQCNLTELCIAKQIQLLDLVDQASGAVSRLPGTSVLDALNPRFQGERPSVDVAGIELVQPDSQKNVYLFRGDIALSEAEDRLAQAHALRTTTDIHQKRNYIAIYDMLSRLAATHGFDYILVDVGPSAGALTRACFLCCDMFLVPVMPDRFNLQAMTSLAAIITRWMKEHAAVVADFKELGLNIPHGRPQLRGLVVQRFQKYRGAPKPAFQYWMDQIPARARSVLFPALVASVGDPSVVPESLKNEPVAAEIPEFSSLAPMMLEHGKPVWALTSAETGWGGSVWDEGAERMVQLRELFYGLAEKFAN